MHAPLITFAWRAATRELVGVAQVERGLDCDCICPACQGKLIARQGDILQWHFAHAAGDERPDCFVTGYSVAMQTLIWRFLAERPVPQPPKLSLQVSPQGGATGIRETVNYQATWLGAPAMPKVASAGSAHPVPESVWAELQSGELVRISLSLNPDQIPRAPVIGDGQLVFSVPSLPKTALSTEAAIAHIEQHGRWQWISHPDIGGALQRAHETIKRRVEEHRQQVAQRWTPGGETRAAQPRQAGAIERSRVDPDPSSAPRLGSGVGVRLLAPQGPKLAMPDPAWMTGRAPKSTVMAWLVAGRVWVGYELFQSSRYRLIPWGGVFEGCWGEIGIKLDPGMQAFEPLDQDAAAVVCFMSTRASATFSSSDVSQLEDWVKKWRGGLSY